MKDVCLKVDTRISSASSLLISAIEWSTTASRAVRSLASASSRSIAISMWSGMGISLV
jgi:hypothetical protein